MAKNYLTIGELPKDLLAGLEAATLTTGANFLSGQLTTVFAPGAEIYNNLSLASNIVSSYVSNIGEISKNLVSMSVKKITNEVTSYLSSKVTDLLKMDFTGDMQYYVTYYTKQYTMSLGDLLTLVISSEDKRFEKERLKAQKEEISNAKKNFTEKISAMKDKVEDTLSTVSGGVEWITTYISNGPQWLVTKLNSYISLVIENTESFIGEQFDSIEKQKQEFVEKIGEKVGKMAAEKINGLVEKTVKDNQTKLELLKQTALNLVYALIAKVIMKIRELTGLPIPIVFG